MKNITVYSLVESPQLGLAPRIILCNIAIYLTSVYKSRKYSILILIVNPGWCRRALSIPDKIAEKAQLVLCHNMP